MVNEQRASQIRLVLTDCDGVLTDAGVYYGETGEVLKRFSIRDGMGVERLRKVAGIQTGIVSGELSPSLRKRAEKLGIEELHLGIKDKPAVLREIMGRLKISAAEIAFIGDDVNDIEALKAVGLSACPSDAMPEVREVCHYTCQLPGGHGAFRELAELIITSKQSPKVLVSEFPSPKESRT